MPEPELLVELDRLPGAVSVMNVSSGSAEAWMSAERISNGATTTNTSVSSARKFRR